MSMNNILDDRALQCLMAALILPAVQKHMEDEAKEEKEPAPDFDEVLGEAITYAGDMIRVYDTAEDDDDDPDGEPLPVVQGEPVTIEIPPTAVKFRRRA